MRIGIDIGGSHISVGLIDSTGNIIKRQEKYIKYGNKINIENFITQQIVSILKDWIATDGIEFEKIGIGAPGIISDDVIVSSVNLGLRNFHIAESLKVYFPDADIKIMNDAKCAALAEKKWGNLKSYDDCIFLCLGTGIGGATFFEGKMVKPRRCAGSEFGHMTIVKDGIPCKCGSKGCFEQYGSMRKFKQTMKQKLNLNDSIDGRRLRNIIRNNMNSTVVQNVINEYIEYLCVGITNLVNIIEPQAICIGGGFVKYKDILFDKFNEELKKSKDLFYKENMPDIVVASFGNDAGMIGSTLIFDE